MRTVLEKAKPPPTVPGVLDTVLAQIEAAWQDLDDS